MRPSPSAHLSLGSPSLDSTLEGARHAALAEGSPAARGRFCLLAELVVLLNDLSADDRAVGEVARRSVPGFCDASGWLWFVDRRGTSRGARVEVLSPSALTELELAALGGCELAQVMRIWVGPLERPSAELLFGFDATSPEPDAADLAFGLAVGTAASSLLERLELKAEAERARRSRDELLSVASHELKGPLNTLHLQIEHLKRMVGVSQGEAPRADHHFERMRRVVRRTARLIETLLDASSLSSGRLELECVELDLTQLARQVAKDLEVELSSAEVELSISGSPGATGSWDPARLEQVLANMLSNAIKYGSHRPVEITVSHSEDTVELIVRDHGIGISPQDRQLLFERFGRTPAARGFAGTGLGLYICRQIVEAHGGRLSVESFEEDGTAFVISLPRRRA